MNAATTTLRERVQVLVLESPEQMVLEMAERLLQAFGERPLQDHMPLRDVSYLVAAMVIASSERRPAGVGNVITVTMDDGVRTTDG